MARQTTEIGIRMALGARRLGVIAAVMRGAMLQTALGLAIGIPAADVCVRFVESQLYELKGVDPTVLLAGLIPARRAASIDPAPCALSDRGAQGTGVARLLPPQISIRPE